MKRAHGIRTIVLGAVLTWIIPPAMADYHSHPELRPENRCVHPHPETGELVSFEEAGIDPLHCQPLFWDLPAAVEVGTVAVEAPFHENAIPRWPHGVTDRPPPMYILDADGDGVSDDGEGYEESGPGRVRLCDDPDTVPTWNPVLDENGNQVIGEDPTGTLRDVEDPTKIQTGPLVEVTCRRGYRRRLGPWQLGTDPLTFDAVFNRGLVRFENTNRLDRDEAEGNAWIDENGNPQRVEWGTDFEFYMHFSSHHLTCWDVSYGTANLEPNPCDDPKNPRPREAYDPGNPDAECRDYQRPADGPDDPEGEGGCYSGSSDPNCDGVNQSLLFRAGTEHPGRLRIEYPTGTGMPGVEDQLWKCDQHAVNQLPPGSYDMTKLANYRHQKGGLVNPSEDEWYSTPPGEVWGGTVGEVILHYFTEAGGEEYRPLNYMFNLVADLATTAYPPFSWNYHETEWVAPYDLAMATFATHSHHRMVKGIINVVPGTIRPNSPDPACGGSLNTEVPPLDTYTNWSWEDAKVCYYWKDPDGPIIVRKGQVVRTTCYVNNGITPEAIKHGLVTEDALGKLRDLGAPIPPTPSAVPTSEWAPLLVDSPLGQEFLYGTHPPINYRVVYKCNPAPYTGSPLGDICDPNPAVDADGDYIDGPYENLEQCGETDRWCAPSAITFQNRGEDEMCIGVGFYYALDRIGDLDGGHDAAMEDLTSGDPERIQRVGLPGTTPNTDPVGRCFDCEAGL